MITRISMLPLWFIFVLQLVTRKQKGIQEVDPGLWAIELDQLLEAMPEGETWLQKRLINELKLWIITEKLRVLRLEGACVRYMGQLPK